MEKIENYEIIQVGKSKNLSNQNFGDYKAIYRTNGPTKGQTYWLCQCNKCNKYYVLNAYTLVHGKNICECNNNLTGQKFGRWIVLYLTENKTKNRGRIYHCKCTCGNEKDVPAEALRSGESQSCGCYNKERVKENNIKNRLDLTGQRFGKLVALYGIYSATDGGHTKWHCKCDCGNECDIDMGNLRSGKSQSCGCTQSKQEENIIKLLTKNNIPFEYQYRFKDFPCKKFDFYISNKYIIEFDGQQHFWSTHSGWDTKEHLKRVHQSDLEKNKYCFNNNIPLIRIPYNANYTIDDLKLETTRFLLTPEKEDNYYADKN